MTKTIVKGHRRITRSRIVFVKQHKRKIPEKFRNQKYLQSLKRGKPILPFKQNLVFKTTFIQDPKTGLLQGRKSVPGFGDRTPVQIDTNTGRIFGRLPKKKIIQRKK